MTIFHIAIKKLQPSKLYINFAKLDKICPHDLLRPIPVKQFGSDLVMTDGHSRVVFAIRDGKDSVLAEWERDELDWESYMTCVKWCRLESIFDPYPLVDRIVSDDKFKKLWLERWQLLHK